MYSFALHLEKASFCSTLLSNKDLLLAEFAEYLCEYGVSEDLRVLFQLKSVEYCDRLEGISQLLFSNPFLQYVLSA